MAHAQAPQDGAVGLPFGVGLTVESGAMANRAHDLARLTEHDDRVARLVAPVAGLDERRQIDYVQAVVGQMIVWRADRDLYGESDHWAGPRETLARRAGDCEDIAILKLSSLANLGVAPNRLALVVGRDTARGDHAIAAVRTARGWRLLDDDGPLRSAESYASFEPTFVLADGRAYLHARKRAVEPAAP